MAKRVGRTIIFVAVLLILFGKGLVGLYTDWLWFDSHSYSVVFTTILMSQIKLGLLSGLLFLAIIYGNLWLAKRLVPAPPKSLFEQRLLERLGKLARRGVGIVIFVGSVLVSIFVGFNSAAFWQDWLKFLNPTQFGILDPLYGRDIAFYVFTMPFLSKLYYWLFMALFLSAVATAALYYAEEGIGMTNGGTRLRVHPKARVHLSILIAAMFLLKAGGYLLDMAVLGLRQGSLFYGASYADVHATLPGLWVLLVATVLGAIVVLASCKRDSIKPVAWSFGGLVGLSILMLGVYPAAVQGLVVKPNEQAREREFISRAITATQKAYGLTDVAAREFPADTTLSTDQIGSNLATIQNIRLWDPQHIQEAYSQIQTIQQYYQFPDADVDRYWLTDPTTGDKSYRQVWLGARELDQDALPMDSQTWVNRHFQYTHGYGYVMSPVNEVSSEGMPKFFVNDIPPKSNTSLEIKNPQIYYGEMTSSHVFVKTSTPEFDYPTGSTTETTIYTGNSGVWVGNLWRRLLYAVQLSDINILLNKNYTSETRILYTRRITEMAKKLLPVLSFDRDPYLVTVDGSLYYILDAYTTSDMYPYSYKLGQEGGSGLNYIRNSAKLVINAYTGEMNAYINDRPSPDPIIQTYQKMFPGVFKPMTEMPKELLDHVRYPEDLFRIQADVYATYHMTDPTVFYHKSDLWQVPDKARLGQLREGGEMEPYYVTMKLPNGDSEEFILMIPFNRANKTNMVSWMCAKCDQGDYGRLVLFNFPQRKNIAGPGQIAARANQDTLISQQISLWDQSGSQVSTGNLLVIPIDTSLLYVMPVYLESVSTKIPELKRVIVVLGDRVSMQPTLAEALAEVVGVSVKTVAPAGGASVSTATAGGQPAGPGKPVVRQLIDQAASSYDRAQEAIRRGDWAEYGSRMKELKSTLESLRSAAK